MLPLYHIEGPTVHTSFAKSDRSLDGYGYCRLYPLAYCTCLVNVDLTIRTILLQVRLLEPGYSILNSPPRPDIKFGVIDVEPLRGGVASSRFNSLTSVSNESEPTRNHGAYSSPLVTDVDLLEAPSCATIN